MPDFLFAYNVDAAVQSLMQHAGAASTGNCAQYVRQAIQAGGIVLSHTHSAKDYGQSLRQAGFQTVTGFGSYQKGDVVVIQGFGRESTATGSVTHDHLHGHMAMYNGWQWVSDFAQRPHSQPGYPGLEYDRAQPMYAVYRYPPQSNVR